MTDPAVELETVEPVESAQSGQPAPVSDEELSMHGACSLFSAGTPQSDRRAQFPRPTITSFRSPQPGWR
ncbi:hypothetical protein EW053_29615 [Streptomyces sp. IB2014 016-6]|nr:hypothetical protein EW053_29615 [Streptomyces sp. IB2014 016-6]